MATISLLLGATLLAATRATGNAGYSWRSSAPFDCFALEIKGAKKLLDDSWVDTQVNVPMPKCKNSLSAVVPCANAGSISHGKVSSGNAASLERNAWHIAEVAWAGQLVQQQVASDPDLASSSSSAMSADERVARETQAVHLSLLLDQRRQTMFSGTNQLVSSIASSRGVVPSVSAFRIQSKASTADVVSTPRLPTDVLRPITIAFPESFDSKPLNTEPTRVDASLITSLKYFSLPSV